jgi:hypothetical protein
MNNPHILYTLARKNRINYHYRRYIFFWPADIRSRLASCRVGRCVAIDPSWLVVVHLIYRASRAAELRDAYFLGTASAIAYGTRGRRWPLAESGRGRSLAAPLSRASHPAASHLAELAHAAAAVVVGIAVEVAPHLEDLGVELEVAGVALHGEVAGDAV